MDVDCDQDTLLIKANPQGPTCHTGADTCWNERNVPTSFFHHLEQVVQNRIDNPTSESYINKFLKKNINRVAKKVGEGAVELVIEAKDNDEKLFLNEAANLIWHYIILLKAKGCSLSAVENILRNRHE
jgi:phosphoribosyl-ATP pyrophosphohydrolase/phosphoribosyl-AMP cyclohydrolase